MIIKPDSVNKKILLAPMAGITDKPYRQICREMGAHACVSEMVTSNTNLYCSMKSKFRRDLTNEDSPRIVQIAGTDPSMMAEAAILNVANGADVIDINMGCPAKKVCNAMAGSALLKDELLVSRILEKVVGASDVPVTLKIRTGWSKTHKNALKIAEIAENSGIQVLTVHGRTRECYFTGKAEHDTAACIKSRVSIKVIANGDINSAEEAFHVLQQTGADGIMIGRAAVGNPWIFSEIRTYLSKGIKIKRPSSSEVIQTVVKHLQNIYQHYGEYIGVRIARKHIYKYCKSIVGFEMLRIKINKEERCERQLEYVKDFLTSAGNLGIAT